MKEVKDSRTFAALLPQSFRRTSVMERGVGVFVVIFLISFTVTLSVLLWNVYTKYQLALTTQQEARKELSHWEEVISKHPNVPGVYYEAAINAVRLSEYEKAEKFITDALRIDPNFFEAEVLANEIERRQ